MITPLAIALIVYDTYWDEAGLSYTLEIDDVFVGVKTIPDGIVICFRGSTTPEDWYRDFQANMIDDNELGGVEAGFIQGLRQVFAHFGDFEGLKEIYICGHSLGAARATLFAELCKVRGIPVTALFTFGSPRAGALKGKSLLANTPIQAYKNRMDPVTEVPFDIPRIAPYVHVSHFIHLNEDPPLFDSWGILADHHFELYLDGIKRLSEADIGA